VPRFVARPWARTVHVQEAAAARWPLVVASAAAAEITARRSPVGLYDRFLVPWALKRMLNRQMVAVSTTLAGRRR
jgi:hypothetical protein